MVYADVIVTFESFALVLISEKNKRNVHLVKTLSLFLWTLRKISSAYVSTW